MEPLKNKVDEFEGEFQKRYFTPSIEDIRVGYECEILIVEKDRDKENFWKPVQLSPFMVRVQIEAINLKDVVRVPYLTKEQIEAEGYSLTEMNKGKYIKYSGGDLHIYDHNGDTCYLGECKDINTFSYICKLLGI